MEKTEKTQPAKKTKLHIAWTVDDGPTPYTDKMLSVFNSTLKKAIPATWFIQFDYLIQKNRLAFYKNLQNKKKHEIAIHGVSTVVNHIHWFPSSKHQSFPSIDEALEAIAIFNKYLSDNGIQAKFVRVPTGLHSELSSYLNKLKAEGNTYQIARDIIKDKQLKEVKKKKNKKNNKEVLQYRLKKKVAVDFMTLKLGLSRQKLQLWGGKSSGRISANSWEIESAGNKTGRQDSLTIEFLSELYQNVKKDRSLVILCHDTKPQDIEEVKKDILMIDKFATENDIEVIYHTMSSLYQEVVGKTP